jgi:hypothetical protein
MPVKTTLPYNDGLYFITLTCHQWLPLIELTKNYDVVYKWFDYLKSKGHYITGYIIMPNPRLTGTGRIYMHYLVFTTVVNLSIQLSEMEKDSWLMK